MEFTGEYFIPGLVQERIEKDHKERYAFASKFVQNAVILDIACGVGYGSLFLLEGGALSYTGVDINEQAISYAINNYSNSKSIFQVGDILTFSKGLYDCIVCFETIEHIQYYDKAIGNLYKLLKKDGKLIISSPNRHVTSPRADGLSDLPANKFHFQEFIPEELIEILRTNGFYNIEIFGQRQRLWFQNILLRKICNRFFDPDNRTSAKVRPVKLLTPRYFILTAQKK